MRHLTPKDYRRMSWRNGGGTTTELVVEAGEDGRFLYRTSIAEVASDGPFSRFAGYDRHIMLVEGAGMTIDCGSFGRVDLTAPFAPRSFSGDWDVSGALVDGPVRDFNLIVDRERATSSLAVRLLVAPEPLSIPDGSVRIIHVLEGALEQADTGDTLVVDAPLDLVPRGSARLVLASIAVRRAL